MDRSALASRLAEIRFTASLPAAVLDRIAAVATLHDYSTGTRLFREGSTSGSLMIICRGRVALDMFVPGRGNVRILSLGAGDMLAWSALLGEGRMTASAIVLEATELLLIPAEQLLAACDDAEFGYQLMRRVAEALAERLVATRLQLLDLFAESEPQPSSQSNS